MTTFDAGMFTATDEDFDPDVASVTAAPATSSAADSSSSQLGGTAYSLQADEQALLGAMLIAPARVGGLVGQLVEEDFFYPRHRTLFSTIRDMHRAGAPVDPVALAGVLQTNGTLREVGGAEYLHTLMDSCPTATNAEWYLARLGDARRRRAMQATLVRSQQMLDDGQDVDEVWLRAQTASVEWQNHAGGDVIEFGDSFSALFDKLENPEAIDYVSTGLTDLDRLLNGGLTPGQMIVVGGRPGTGKTVVGLKFGRTCAFKQRKPVLFVSLEMTPEELTQRVISAECRVLSTHVRAGGNALTESDWGRMAKGLSNLVGGKLLIADATHADTFGKIVGVAERTKQKYPDLGLIVIDYVQLINLGTKAESRQAELSAISRGIKQLGLRLGVPVVVLAQLNRNPAAQGRKPVLTDLRETGALEQDADIVILLHREDLIDPTSDSAGEVELIIPKHRGGTPGTTFAAAQLHYMDYADLSRANDVA